MAKASRLSMLRSRSIRPAPINEDGVLQSTGDDAGLCGRRRFIEKAFSVPYSSSSASRPQKLSRPSFSSAAAAASSESSSSSSSSVKTCRWNRPGQFARYRRRPVPNYGRQKLTHALSEERLLLLSDEPSSTVRKSSSSVSFALAAPATNYQSCDVDRRPNSKMLEPPANTELMLRNGAKRSVGNQSRKSIIIGPPVCDDVLDELDMMETSLKRRRQKTLRQQWRIFCQRSTLHGLSDLSRAENLWLRIFWTITFVGAMAAAVYGCYHILDQYMASPVVVSYFVQESELKFPLPDLVICPFNRFNAEYLKNYSVPMDVAQHMQLVFGMSAKHPNQRRELARYASNQSMLELDLAMNETLERLNTTFDEFLEDASLKCSEFFVDCAFPTGSVTAEKCCNNTTGVMTFAGKCYRIRGVDQSGPGYGYGMTIVVSLPKNLYSLAVNNWLNDGILVKLAEPGQGIDYDMTFIPVGTHALMPLKATKYEFMDDPPRFECLQSASVNYSRVDCFDECFVEAAQNHCHCAVVGNFNRHKLPLCTTRQFYYCIFEYLKNQFNESQDSEHYFFGCRQRCKPRCTYWQYQSAISYSKFPSEEARAFAQSDEEWTKMKNTIIVDLYYEKLEFTRIKHYRAMTIHGFIANLGGQYSLWLGGSILTLMQLAVFVFNYAVGRCRQFMYGRSDQPPVAFTGTSIATRFQSSGGGQPFRSSSALWRSRSSSAGPGTGARRQSTLSDDLHPQLQALTQQNYYTNIGNNRSTAMSNERRPPSVAVQSNGTCCRRGDSPDDHRTAATAGTYRSVSPTNALLNNHFSGWSDAGGAAGADGHSSADDGSGGDQWQKRTNSNGACRRRSPSLEADHSTTSDSVYRHQPWEPSVLDDFREKRWTSET